MKKYKKNILMLITLVIIIQIINFSILRKLQDILSISSNTVIDYCSVFIINYKSDGKNYDNNVKLTETQFKDIIEIMEKTKYHKTFKHEYYDTDTDGFYFIDFTYLIDDTKKVRRMTFTKDGYIDINSKNCYISMDESDEVVSSIYEYINNIIEKNKEIKKT